MFYLIDFSNERISLNNPKEKEKLYKDSILKINDAYEKSGAEIILDDKEFSSILIAEKNGIPRISIQRTGFFRSIENENRNPAHMHSMEKGSNGKSMDLSFILQPKKLSSKLLQKQMKAAFNGDDVDYYIKYLDAETKLIPGIKTIEQLPENIENKDSYFYTGPLLIEDNPSEGYIKELNQFLEYNKNKKTVFITAGILDQDNVQDMLLMLLRNEYAVISTCKLTCNHDYKERFFYDRFISMNYICPKVDLIIHHCGNGIYHYPLLHKKPTITISTQCYDREDIAIRLEQLNISRHVVSPEDDENYMEKFIESLESFERGNLCDFNKLDEIKKEIYSTMLDFDIEKVIEYTMK